MSSAIPGNDSQAVLQNLRSALTHLASGQVPHKDLLDKYRENLTATMTLPDRDTMLAGVKCFVEAVVNENVSLVISRQLLADVGVKLAETSDDAVAKEISHYTLDIVQPRVISFEEQVRL